MRNFITLVAMLCIVGLAGCASTTDTSDDTSDEVVFVEEEAPFVLTDEMRPQPRKKATVILETHSETVTVK